MKKVDIVIPVQSFSNQLDRTLELLGKFKNETAVEVHVIERPDLNVSEARQLILDDEKYDDFVCYLDDDSEMIHDGWLDEMVKTMSLHDDCGCVFGGEWWGTQERPIVEIDYNVQVGPESGGTPAACMLISKQRLTANCVWDQNIGLRSGWLGGDFEEVDFAYRLVSEGIKMYRSTGTTFHHTGGKTSLFDFCKTDRANCVAAMRVFLEYRYISRAWSDDYFKGLKYVKADPNDDCMLAAGYSLRECYKEVIQRNGFSRHPFFIRYGLT